VQFAAPPPSQDKASPPQIWADKAVQLSKFPNFLTEKRKWV